MKLLQMKLEYRSDRVNVARMSMAVVLSHVVKVKREMFIDLPGYSKEDAVTNPCGRNRIVKDFVGHEPGELSLAEFYWMFNLQAIAVLREVWSRIVEVKLEAISIADGETSGGKLYRRL